MKKMQRIEWEKECKRRNCEECAQDFFGWTYVCSDCLNGNSDEKIEKF